MTTSSTPTTTASPTLADLLNNNSGALVGLAALASFLGPTNPGTGYQGTVNPNEALIRGQVAGAQPVNEQAYGQNYFTPSQYVDTTNAGNVSTAIQNAITQGTSQQAANMANTAAPPNSTPAPIAMPWLNNKNPIQAQTPFTNPQPSAASSGIASPSQIEALQAQLANLQQNPAQIEQLGQNTIHAATGGQMPVGIASMAHGGQYLQGRTDGMADKLHTSIDGTQPARLSHGEFVIPADVVSHLGNGNSDAGAQHLYKMMDRIREARTGNKKQGKQIDPDRFTPGGIAGYAMGGNVQKFDAGGTPAATSAPAPATTTASSTSNTSSLAPYAGQYVTNMLSQGEALANTPMPVYTGQLTAGPSALQQSQFAGLQQLAQTGEQPIQFQSGTWNDQAAQQYMSPYLQASLNPQLAALNQQAQISEQGDLSKLTQSGAFGGTRQAVLQGQDAYTNMANQANLIGQGYNTAYTNAENQFNTANAQSIQAQQNQQAANEAAANFQASTLKDMGAAGATQQGLAQAADTAALNQFNTQAQAPYQQLNFESNLLTGLPIGSTTTTSNQSTLGNLLNSVGGSTQLLNLVKNIFPTGTTPTDTTATSTGVTGGSGSNGEQTLTNMNTSYCEGGTIVMPELIVSKFKKARRSKKTNKE
jgi:hypothetical protein